MPLTPEDLDARKREVDASPDLTALAQRLERLLAPLLDRPLYLPHAKALLSRDGGVCREDGSRLRFDPLNPERHECPVCERVHTGERHHRAWIWRYHLWLSERAIHLALLGGLHRRADYLDKAREILDAYAALYPEVPNRDNVLGPTRLFFSTYLESIWLTQLVIAGTLLERAGEPRPSGAFDRAVQESADLITSFDEGWSNRQVWNNAASMAAGLWLGRDGLVGGALDGTHGIRAQLTRGVTADGLWFEGENYHFFALRGLLLAAEVARWAGIDLYGTHQSAAPLAAMYVAPLDTLLPDLTLPARGDSPYGVSILQPRFAELWEIGRARVDEPRIGSLLAGLYGREAPSGKDEGFRDLAEQETNVPGQRTTRDMLGWKSLLWMMPDAPSDPPDRWVAGSRLMRDAGVVLLRPRRDCYVSLECGGARGGHGHPDLLHVSLHVDGPRLADFGTGSYVSPSLHWFRSTLAHNAPGLPDLGQVARAGRCTAFEDRGNWAWCRVVADRLFGDGTSAVRVLLAGPDYVLDILEVVVPEGVTVELPVHPLAGLPNRGQDDTEAGGGDVDLERLALSIDGEGPEVVFAPRVGESLRVQVAPGPPTLALADGSPLPFLVRCASGAGRWVQAYAYRAGCVSQVRALDGSVRIELASGAVHEVRLGKDELLVDGTGGATLEFGGRQPPPVGSPHARMTPIARRSIRCPIVSLVPDPDQWEQVVPREATRALGAKHYRRSEDPYAESFSARAAVFAHGSQVCFAATVSKPEVCFWAPDTADPKLDNEVPDIHSDGVQCYVGTGSWQGFVAVPDADSKQVHVRSVAGPVGDVGAVFGEWRPTEHGYSIVVVVDVGRRLHVGDILSVNLVVNEMYPDRERRAGQLALSGGGGWVYLRGDRESPGWGVMAEVL